MISKNSRYVDTQLISNEGKNYYGAWKRVDELMRIKDTIRFNRHTVIETEVGCLDMIALRYYRNERLGWIIAAFNEIIDPVADMRPGQQLKIPDRLFITAFLTRS
jgi:hypothetical protein